MRLLLSALLLMFFAFSSAVEDCGTSFPNQAEFRGHGSNDHARIIGGSPVPVGKWPWQVLLATTDTEGEYNYICGGSIIGKRWILTAAHCLYSMTFDSIWTGIVNRQDTRTEEGISSVKTIIIHEQYDESKQYDFLNDIALIELKEPIVFDATVHPICLPALNITIPEKAIVVATGFGDTIVPTSNITQSSHYLQETAFPLIPNDICRERWGPLPDTQICAGSSGNGTAEGDSGGPLMIESKNSRWFQLGITSFGANSYEEYLTQDANPGVYTNVAKYCDWIGKKTRGEVKCMDAVFDDAPSTVSSTGATTPVMITTTSDTLSTEGVDTATEATSEEQNAMTTSGDSSMTTVEKTGDETTSDSPNVDIPTDASTVDTTTVASTDFLPTGESTDGNVTTVGTEATPTISIHEVTTTNEGNQTITSHKPKGGTSTTVANASTVAIETTPTIPVDAVTTTSETSQTVAHTGDTGCHITIECVEATSTSERTDDKSSAIGPTISLFLITVVVHAMV